LSSVLPAIVTTVAFALAVWRLPALHPIQVWTGSWTFSTILYALRLLPYQHLSWLTSGLICGSVLVFSIGALLGSRLGERRPAARAARDHMRTVEIAAWLSLGLLSLTFAVFVGQLVHRFGLGPVVRIDPEVKLYLTSGEAPLSGTYVDVAIAGAATCALAAALARERSRRIGWLVAVGACAASVYFSTSRAFIVVALITGFAALVAAGWRIDRRQLAAVGVVWVTATLAIFIGLGSVLGKTYGSSGIESFDNFFSRHPAVTWLALPYEDASASIPALNLLTRFTPTWGIAHGCATAPIACGGLRKLGVPTLRVPVAGPFTKAPLRWNGYTFLERFLIDGGSALALVLVVATGLLAGFAWARARAGTAAGIIVYAIAVPGLLAAYRQNLIQLLAIAAVVACVLLLVARLLSGFALQIGRNRQGEAA
jgi:oligosaccharide repeat unit polymerase